MSRILRLKRQLTKLNFDNFLVTHLSNIRYLCGFSGSAGVQIITPKKVRFFTDFRYQEQAAQQVHDAEVIIYKADYFKELKRHNYKLKGRTGFEAAYLDVLTFNLYKSIFPNTDWIPSEKVIEEIAAVKEPSEIDIIRQATAITDQVFAEILPLIKPGINELDISAEISYLHKKKGADGDSFDPIVASGPRSALPHGIASDRKIKANEPVTIDMGGVYQGYASDLTRTVFVGRADSKFINIYNLVRTAQKAAMRAVRPGMKAKDLDEIARKVIRDEGYADHFGHGLGHGLGLDIHGEPRINSLSNDVLTTGHVFTIEPGVYIPGFGGVRIEDDILVTTDGCEVLTKSPRELIEL
ncbi:Xaa-Pro dipeptidase [candidate division LCP-89 bacterium B3_LCP]|uniref:Xaa-Pro dipeptidase n=1 Tax=candidate division LCP-89 bacterium B3_LCP TaxID=2012998 RepID=A0A532V3T2_UNCL8|nr:MAG: Xaa-Pro dipeptidase [candidate division LCP-89 bacterium B3_LCP]